MIDSYKLAVNIFRLEGSHVYYQYIRLHYFWLFVAAFLSINLLYTSVSIFIINHVDYRVKKKTEAYIFPSFIFSESLFAGNLSVFANLNII